MTYKKDRYDEIGRFSELQAEAKPKVDAAVVETPTGELMKEIYRREKVVPFVKVTEKITAEIRKAGGQVDEADIFFERHFDILGRPELFIGINTSGMTLEQILEEDDKIKRRVIPQRTEGRAIWTDRLIIQQSGTVMPYGYGYEKGEEDQGKFISEFVSRVCGKTILK